MQVTDDLTVGIAGFGTMGSDVAAVCAACGFETVAWNRSAERFEEQMPKVEKAISFYRDSPKEDRERGKELFKTTTDIGDLAGAGLVIENLPEDFEIKTGFYDKVSEHLENDAVLATNTSSLSVAELAAESGRPERFLGLHFFNPASRMELVEVVSHPDTAEEVTAFATEFVERIYKEPIVLGDSPGFVVNRLLVSMVNEATRMLDDGVAEPEQIDDAMEMGTGVPLGPFRLLDLVGLDTHLKVCENLYEQLGEEIFRPPERLERMVEEGKKGKKSGEGFYSY